MPVLNFSHAGGRVEDVDTALAERYSLRLIQVALQQFQSRAAYFEQ